MNQEQIKRIADAYIAAPHTPDHPSYRVLVAETMTQFRNRFTVLGSNTSRVLYLPIPGDLAYESSVEMFRDIERYNRLVVATGGSVFAPNHPLDRNASYNPAFRAVHDYYGHYLGRFPFETFDGEIAAYKTHSRLYSAEARPALYSETVGQLCYYYAYGSFVPAQKAAILPVEVFA